MFSGKVTLVQRNFGEALKPNCKPMKIQDQWPVVSCQLPVSGIIDLGAPDLLTTTTSSTIAAAGTSNLQ